MTACTWALAEMRRATSLAVSDELSQLSKLRRSDPGFGQIAPGESFRELGGIEHVVFHTS
jgi:hypothetical protein